MKSKKIIIRKNVQKGLTNLIRFDSPSWKKSKIKIENIGAISVFPGRENHIDIKRLKVREKLKDLINLELESLLTREDIINANKRYRDQNK